GQRGGGEYGEGPTRGKPRADDQALLDQGSHPILLEVAEQLADSEGHAKEGKTNQQAGSTLLEYLRQLSPRELGLVGEKCPNCFLHHCARLAKLAGVLCV